jgi:hypothetical protein
LPKEELQNTRNSITYEDMLQLQILKQCSWPYENRKVCFS